MKDEKLVLMNFKVPQSTFGKIESVRESLGWSRSLLLRTSVESFIFSSSDSIELLARLMEERAAAAD